MKTNIISAFLLIASFFLQSCGGSEYSSSSTQPSNGEMTESFSPPPSSTAEPASPIEQPKTEEDILMDKGYRHTVLTNGTMPSCYNYQPASGELQNELTVSVGGGTDVVIKVMSAHSEKCVRYVYIRSGSTYSIRNIPEDEYYLKIAYGRDWMSTNENGQCVGMFLSNALYKKGDEILDFNRKETLRGYEIPSFTLSLDVVEGSAAESFNSSGISEEEFNN